MPPPSPEAVQAVQEVANIAGLLGFVQGAVCAALVAVALNAVRNRRG